LKQYALDYDQEAYHWHQLVEEHQLEKHRSTNEWARNMYATFESFFQRPELYPDALDIKFGRLTNDYEELHDAVKEHARYDPVLRAGFEREASTPASEAPAAAELPSPIAAASVHEQRLDPVPLIGENRRSPSQDSQSTFIRPRVTINDSPQRHFYAELSSTNASTSRTSLITLDRAFQNLRDGQPVEDQPAPATHRGVPIVQQLDHGDDSSLSASPQPRGDEVPYDDHEYDTYQRDDYQYSPYERDAYSTPGIMTYADGNVAQASPIAWHEPMNDRSTHSAAYRPAGPTVPLIVSPTGGHTLFGVSATGVGTTRPTRIAPAPPDRPTAQDTSQLMNTTTTAAGGRGPSSSHPSGPQAVDTTAPTIEALSAQESASAFYRNATFHRDDKTTTPLVLKEIPIVAFEGDIRQYTTFRNRFLDIVEGHRDLAPRHKLQYLLQYLRGEPFQLANNFQITDENYFTVVNLLERRYGNVDMIRNLLMADLIALRAPSQSVSDLRKFHGDAFRMTTDLKQLGDDVDSNRLYEQTLMSKLSPALKMELIRNSSYVKEMTASSILDGLDDYIQLLEATANTGVLFSKMSMGNSCPSDRRTPPRSNSPHYSSKAGPAAHTGYAAEAKDVPAADPRQDRTICAFCSLSHWASQCILFRTTSQRWRRARELKYCFLCLRGKHWAEKCPQRTSESCQFCGDRKTHHRALCRMAPNRNWTKGSPRRSPVRNNKGPEACDATGSPCDGPSDDKRHAPVKSVHWSDSRDRESTAHGKVLPSAQRVTQGSTCDGKANSKKITRRKKSRSPGTGPQGRKGTSRPTTTSAAEDMSTKGVNACDVDRLLSGLQSLLSTARCPPTSDPPQFDRARDRAGSCASSVHDPDATLRPMSLFDAVSVNPEWFLPPEEPTAFTVSASIPADTRSVLLECVKVTAANPLNGASREVTAFFDSGSNVTYLSTALATELDLPQQGRRHLRVNTFGTTKPLFMEGFATTVVLHPRRGPSVSLDVTAAPDCIVKAVTTALVEEHELPPLLKDEVTLISSRETPDILIGQDTVQLFKRQTKTQLPNGFDLVQSILGPMIGGAGKVANPSSKNDITIMAASAGTSWPSDKSSWQANGPPEDTTAQSIAPFPPPPKNS
ncbi:Zinc knuckle family protein, partial [Aphelenchoides avenae]